MTVKELFDEWLDLRTIRIRITTKTAYLHTWKVHLSPYWGDKDVTELNKKSLQSFYNHLIKTSGLSPKSALDTMIVLKSCAKLAMDEGYIPFFSTKIEMISSKSNHANDLKVFSESDQKKILDYCLVNPGSYTLSIAITLCSGMRIGEICALTWDDINLVSNVFVVNKSMSRTVKDVDQNAKIKTHIVVHDTKTTAGKREIPITNSLKQILKDYKKIMRGDYYVTTGSERPCEPRTFRNQYYNLLEKAKTDKKLNYHSLRHTFATRLVKSGIDIKTASTIIGHSDVALTLNIYVHPSAEDKQKAVNKAFNKLF